ncbi:MAG: FtsX-like permease family protein [Bacteroides sp.]|nr:FtsX-like permease family protein [Bacteroides sp.]MCM1378572.1 FtsX-like permease family protein [Bacteroides sp.]MCM1444873.1 FtsX-like permease family protein [Prevotella sp.]
MLNLRIALRYLLAKKSHSVVNVISIVSIAGIALATAAMVVVMSVFNGFHSLIEERISVLDPPLAAVAVEGKTLEGADSLCEALKSSPAIADAQPMLQERALAMFGGRQMAIRLRGITPALYSCFDSISPYGQPWAYYHPAASPAVVSVGVANTLQLPVGGEELLGLYVPRRLGRINPANPMSAFRADSVAPSAVFILNQAEVDADLVYAPLTLVENLLQQEDAATQIYIYPTADAKAAQRAAAAILGERGRVLTLDEQQSSTFRIVNMEKWLTFLLLGFILIIASFNVVSSLSLLIIEKRRNAATLMALGATRKRIRNIYRIESMLITAIGTIGGLILGTLLSLGQQHFGWVKLAGDSESLTIEAYPVVFHPADLLAVAAIAVIVGILTALIATGRRN